MKGNLSKKKGFLGDLEGTDLSNIADILEVKYGERISIAEQDISDVRVLAINANERLDEAENDIKKVDNLANSNAEKIGLYGQYLTEKEDKSNKMMVTDDDGTYWSAAMTDMKIYQIIEEHIAQNLNNSEKDKIPSVKAVLDAIKSIKPDVDLSDYYTKTEINNMDLADKAWVVAQIGLNADNYYNKSIIDEMFGDVNSALDELHNYAQSLIGGDAS